MNKILIKNRFFSTLKRLFVVLPLFAIYVASAQEHNVNVAFKEPLVLCADKATSHSFNSTAFVRDGNKNIFVIKNYQNAEHSIHEALGAYIGASVGVRINRVRIIPPHVACVGKAANCVATIHTCVPGTEVNSIQDMHSNVDIYNGLRCAENLSTLVAFDELCDIVALDIFLNNFDRHNGNLFFDKISGHFYAIDMDRVFYRALGAFNDIRDLEYAFSYNLAMQCYEFLEKINGKKLTLPEIEAIRHVHDCLLRLMEQYPPCALYNLWMQFAQEAVYTYNSTKKGCIQTHIHYNYFQSQRLVGQMERVLDTQSRMIKDATIRA